jgi:hypothetical protein
VLESVYRKEKSDLSAIRSLSAHGNPAHTFIVDAGREYHDRLELDSIINRPFGYSIKAIATPARN